MKQITITEKDAKKYKFPAKAVGYWGVMTESETDISLHRMKKDGTLGSNRTSNILKMNKTVAPEFFTKNIVEHEKPAEKIPDEDKLEKTIVKTFKLGARKLRWIVKLIEAMKDDPFGQQAIEKLGGEIPFAQKVIEDTDPEREFGKAYSSISSAMKVWNSRMMRGAL